MGYKEQFNLNLQPLISSNSSLFLFILLQPHPWPVCHHSFSSSHIPVCHHSFSSNHITVCHHYYGWQHYVVITYVSISSTRLIFIPCGGLSSLFIFFCLTITSDYQLLVEIWERGSFFPFAWFLLSVPKSCVPWNQTGKLHEVT